MSTKTTYIDISNTPLIPEGMYDLKFIEHETGIRFSKKVILWFEVVSHGKYEGTQLARYYNVLEHFGKPGIGGMFRVGDKSDFVREHIRVFGEPETLNEISVDDYDGKIVVGRVHTVTKSSTKSEIPKCLQYSTVSELIDLKESHEKLFTSNSDANDGDSPFEDYMSDLSDSNTDFSLEFSEDDECD